MRLLANNEIVEIFLALIQKRQRLEILYEYSPNEELLAEIKCLKMYLRKIRGIITDEGEMFFVSN